jgi:DNA (cytosine-5)-methyltransferase 1
MTNPHAWNLTDLKDVQPNGISVMSTFACGGGSSLGYKRLGCEILAANDIDPEMAYHYKLNLKPKHYFLCPIKDLITAELPPELFSLDILDGSPPCSSFSMAGNREKDWGKKKHFREGQAEQVLDDLFFDYLNLVDRLKPKVSIAENVKGMIQGAAKGYVKMIFQRYKEIGYRPQLFLVNAADCGVPQKRERVFFVALRNDIEKAPLVLKPQHRWVGVRDACEDIGEDLDGYEQFTAINKAFTVKGLRPTHPLSSPSATLTGTDANENLWNRSKNCFRKFTYREWKRLGSFPDDYQAKTDKIGKYMIGMSVPPKMTEQVAKAVIEQWLT